MNAVEMFYQSDQTPAPAHINETCVDRTNVFLNTSHNFFLEQIDDKTKQIIFLNALVNRSTRIQAILTLHIVCWDIIA